MDTPRITYREQDDTLHIAISGNPETGNSERNADITMELDESGETRK